MKKLTREEYKDCQKALLKAAGVSFLPSKYWKNMEENDGA